MPQAKRKWDRLTDDQRRTRINELITFFKEDRGEEIGLIAGEQILDFFLQNAGSDLYNKGLKDAHQALERCFEDLKVDLDVLLD